jgi:hypothetical protein
MVVYCPRTAGGVWSIRRYGSSGRGRDLPLLTSHTHMAVKAVCMNADKLCCGVLQLGTHLRAKRKREEMSQYLRKSQAKK